MAFQSCVHSRPRANHGFAKYAVSVFPPCTDRVVGFQSYKQWTTKTMSFTQQLTLYAGQADLLLLLHVGADLNMFYSTTRMCILKIT